MVTAIVGLGPGALGFESGLVWGTPKNPNPNPKETINHHPNLLGVGLPLPLKSFLKVGVIINH